MLKTQLLCGQVSVLMVAKIPIYYDNTRRNGAITNEKILIIFPFKPNPPWYYICNDSRYTYYVCNDSSNMFFNLVIFRIIENKFQYRHNHIELANVNTKSKKGWIPPW